MFYEASFFTLYQNIDSSKGDLSSVLVIQENIQGRRKSDVNTLEFQETFRKFEI